MSDVADQPAQIEGCWNFRDAGGWPIEGGGTMRTGRLFRSDDPTRLTAAGREAIDRFAFSAVVDLRQDAQFRRPQRFAEPARTMHRPLVDRVIDMDNPPVVERPEHLADLYEDMLERSGERLGEILELISLRLADGPVLVHCAFGKDRAGLVSALVQAAIGVPAASIVRDYGRSDGPSKARRAAILAGPIEGDPVSTHAPPALFTAPTAAMEELLVRTTARHGSLAAWVRTSGVSEPTVVRLKAALIDG